MALSHFFKHTMHHIMITRCNKWCSIVSPYLLHLFVWKDMKKFEYLFSFLGGEILGKLEAIAVRITVRETYAFYLMVSHSEEVFWMENMALHCVPILHKSAWHAVYVETHITKQRTKILYVNNSNPSISMLPSKNLCTHIPARWNQPSPNNMNGHTQSHATQAYWQGVCVFVVYSVCACAALRCFRCCGSSGPLASASWSSLN